jgi:hypothetical protein
MDAACSLIINGGPTSWWGNHCKKGLDWQLPSYRMCWFLFCFTKDFRIFSFFLLLLLLLGNHWARKERMSCMSGAHVGSTLFFLLLPKSKTRSAKVCTWDDGMKGSDEHCRWSATSILVRCLLFDFLTLKCNCTIHYPCSQMLNLLFHTWAKSASPVEAWEC